MGTSVKPNNLWVPLTNEELEQQIEAARNISKVQPRPLSLVKFAEDSSFRQTVDKGFVESVSMNDFNRLLYLGPIPNHCGHGAFINLKNKIIHVIDIEELVEIDEEDV